MLSRPLSDHAFRICAAGVLLAGAIAGLIAIGGINGAFLAIVFVAMLGGMALRSRISAIASAKTPPPDQSPAWWRCPVWQYTSLAGFAIWIAVLVWYVYTNLPSS